MKNNILLSLALSFLFICCSPNKYKESVHDNNDSSMIDKKVLEIIDTIRTDIKADSIFFILSMYNQNDSSFLLLTEDVQPPLIFDYKPYKGYYKYKKDYIFIFSTLNDSISNKFFIEEGLKNNINDLKKLSFNSPSPIYDGNQHIYYIDKNFRLKLLK